VWPSTGGLDLHGGQRLGGNARVQDVSDWLHGQVRFDYNASSPTLPAVSVLSDGVGVCRYFTHLGIAICRALNVPAQYVFGYLPDIGVEHPDLPMDFSAWMEVYWAIDGTRSILATTSAGSAGWSSPAAATPLTSLWPPPSRRSPSST